MALDWKRCIICQKVTSESLKCPINSLGSTTDAKKNVCRSFLENVSDFKSLDALPINLPFGCDETTETSAVNQAS